MIRAGQLRDFVIIEEPNSNLTPSGNTAGWVEFARVYVSIEPLTGRELTAERALQSPINTRIRTWYLPGVKPSMRIILGERKFNIRAVIDTKNMHVELELACVEVQ